jgi:hypothetical protein
MMEFIGLIIVLFVVIKFIVPIMELFLAGTYLLVAYITTRVFFK